MNWELVCVAIPFVFMGAMVLGQVIVRDMERAWEKLHGPCALCGTKKR